LHQLLTPVEEEMLQRLEDRYPYNQLLTFRRLAHSMLAAQKKEQQRKQQQQQQQQQQEQQRQSTNDVGAFFTRMWAQVNNDGRVCIRVCQMHCQVPLLIVPCNCNSSNSSNNRRM
jgi:transcription initiation factor TFIID subunit TAF12